jgi:hypothetical protein
VRGPTGAAAIASGVALCVLPVLLSAAALMVGVLATSLTLVYVSIGLGALALPSLVLGILLIVHGARS